MSDFYNDLNPREVFPPNFSAYDDVESSRSGVICELCGEWIGPDSALLSDDKNVEVRIRVYENDGVRLNVAHPSCAANHLIGCWIGSGHYDVEWESREDIGFDIQRVAGQFFEAA